MTTEFGRLVADTVTEAQRQHALDRAINGLREDDPLKSASIPVMGWQRLVLWGLLVLTVGFADPPADADGSGTHRPLHVRIRPHDGRSGDDLPSRSGIPPHRRR